jgi:uncharacterized protein (DUF1501 family)
MAHTHAPQRRDFLKLSARLAALGLTGLGLGATRTFVEREVEASTVSDYKALVCVYLFGGNDSNNMIVPVDTARYTAYQSTRGGLILPSSRLLSPIADAAGQPYALHSAMATLNPLFASGDLAVVLNMGPLNRPLSRDEYLQGASRPQNLFSHSDQTLQAQAGTSTMNGSGWGGRLLDCFQISDTLAAVSVSSPALFLDGGVVRGNVVPPGANLQLSGMSATRREAVAAMLRPNGGNPQREAANRAFADGLQLGDTLSSSERLPALATVFPTSSLGTQLREVSRLIRLRSVRGPGRQVFFCSLGGWDTHAAQDGTHTSLLTQLSQGLAAFHTATLEMGLADKITTFTQSEFNRTMQTNGSGTDHAWGGHQLVVGGGVRGGIYGELPTFALGGPDDANTRGVWIPKISTSQYGATLGRWFGASTSELQWAFPNLTQFASPDIGFMA